MFKVNNKDVRASTFEQVNADINFEQVNAGWVETRSYMYLILYSATLDISIFGAFHLRCTVKLWSSAVSSRTGFVISTTKE